MSEGCGSCTLCCKLLGVRELDKPPGTWCSHCLPGRGCKVYEDRPESCRVYRCMWLRTQSQAHPWSPGLRPDRSHVIFTEPPDKPKRVVATVDPLRRDAWRHSPNKEIIEILVKIARVTVAIDCDKANLVLSRLPDGRILEEALA